MKLLKFIFISILAMVVVSCSSYDEPELKNTNENAGLSGLSMSQIEYSSPRPCAFVRLYKEGRGDTYVYSFTYEHVEVIFYGSAKMANGAAIHDCKVFVSGLLPGVEEKTDVSWHCLSGDGYTGLNVVIYYKITAEDDDFVIGQDRRVADYTFWIDFEDERVTCCKLE